VDVVVGTLGFTDLSGARSGVGEGGPRGSQFDYGPLQDRLPAEETPRFTIKVADLLRNRA
jgi:hypothetical protein